MRKTECAEAEISAKKFYNIYETMEVIAERFIKANPKLTYRYFGYSKNGFTCIPKRHGHAADEEVIDFDKKYPNAKPGQVAYAYYKRWSNGDAKQLKGVNPECICEIFVNGELVYKSTASEEIDLKRQLIYLPMKNGWNDVLVRCEKTYMGFSCQLSCDNGSFSPFKEYDGFYGTLYSELCENGHRYPEGKMPVSDMSVKDDELEWFPKLNWEKQESTPFERIFPETKLGEWAIARSTINIESEDSIPAFSGEALSDFTVYIDGDCAFEINKTEKFYFSPNLSKGEHNILICTQKQSEERWGVNISCSVPLHTPCNINGFEWIYAGRFESINKENICSYYDLSLLLDNAIGKDYWHLDGPDLMVRAAENGTLFGKWNYPLGVTLYGLYKTGKYLKNEKISDYVKSHIENCTAFYDYARWDRENYNHTLLLDMMAKPLTLDYCGSMGSTSLEVSLESEKVQKVASNIAKFIDDEIKVTAEKNFYRDDKDNETIWADDMYMSLPFLSRYYKLTGDERVMDKIADQILGFKHYLYMEDKKYLSHVYSVTRKKQCGIPWSRGNGWCIFSLSEVLEFMAANHPKRAEITDFFKILAETYLKLQNEDGMWHQVLDISDSFEESSGTAMIIYAFARAVRLNWVDGELKQKLMESALKGVDALHSRFVDNKGNVYGVCCGSGYGFSNDYYANHLRPVVNDTHGIGITLLAFVETELMKETH